MAEERERHEGAASPAPPDGAKPRPRSGALIAAGGIAVVLALGAAAFAWVKPKSADSEPAAAQADEAPQRGNHEGEPPPERAARLRREAATACQAAEWRKCQNKLDRARRFDPAGEDDPGVKRLRVQLRDQ
jgi:hypothetical protein